MKSLTNEQQKSYQDTNICYIFKEKIKDKYIKDNKYQVRDLCHDTGGNRDAAHLIYNLKYSVPKEVSKVFHNGSNHNYQFIMKELLEKFERKFICLDKH